MSGNLKIQILGIIIFEKFLPKFKSSLLSLYYLCETELKQVKLSSMHFYCETTKPLVTTFEEPRIMSFVFGYEHNQKVLRN